ncbi:hypothetical protein [Candidatus Nitrosocosmicus hydrocola]|uniref:hypothetical protein n=1 Tax=Candidatus Nitrosocosmicus hydrocola TaxID=1826872 RepID=UPI0011E5AAA6|nr:hypothetical protein [Candidatus Nitrosocosmicus hydrocola]
MVSIQSVIIPGIIIGIIGGITMFFAAYSYYPEKHLNVNLNGQCYEFVDSAFSEYEKLAFEKEIMIKTLQTQAIGDLSLEIPITFTGTNLQVDNFLKAISVKVTDYYEQGHPNTELGKVMVKGTMSNSEIVEFLNMINKNITDTNARENLYSFGIQPNIHISNDESHQIGQKMDKFMKNGLTSISDNENGVKNTECRTKIVYNDGDI